MYILFTRFTFLSYSCCVLMPDKIGTTPTPVCVIYNLQLGIFPDQLNEKGLEGLSLKLYLIKKRQFYEPIRPAIYLSESTIW